MLRARKKMRRRAMIGQLCLSSGETEKTRDVAFTLSPSRPTLLSNIFLTAQLSETSGGVQLIN